MDRPMNTPDAGERYDASQDRILDANGEPLRVMADETRSAASIRDCCPCGVATVCNCHLRQAQADARRAYESGDIGSAIAVWGEYAKGDDGAYA